MTSVASLPVRHRSASSAPRRMAGSPRASCRRSSERLACRPPSRWCRSSPTPAPPADPHQQTIVGLGVNCSIQALVGRFGCTSAALGALSKSGGVVVSPQLASRLGKTASIQTDVGPIPVSSAIRLPTLDAFNHGQVAVFGLAEAQRLFARDNRFDAIYVIPRPGADLGRSASPAAKRGRGMERRPHFDRSAAGGRRLHRHRSARCSAC